VAVNLAAYVGMRERVMMDKLQIIDVGFENVDACGCCGANTLGQQRKREWIKQCLPYGLRYKTVLERTSGRMVGMIFSDSSITLSQPFSNGGLFE